MSRRTCRTFLTLSVAAAVLGLLGWGLTRDAFVLPSPLVGNPAPSFDLPVMPESSEPELGRWQGRDTVSLSETEGLALVVNFWASWCLACREEHPLLSAAADRYRDRGVRFYGILYQDTPANARRFIREMGAQTYPTLLDPKSTTAIDFGVCGVPETYFVSAAGIVAHKHTGPVTADVLRSQIDSLLALAGP